MFLLSFLLACTPKQQPPADVSPVESVSPAATLTFGPLVAERAHPGVTATVREVHLGDRPIPIGFHPLLETGQTYGGAMFGELRDQDGQPIPWPEGRDAGDAPHRLCNVGDFGSLIQAHGQLFHLAHLECAIGGASVSRLTQSEDGMLKAGPPRIADLKAVHGGTTFCSGDVTPWNTHLASEEYDANARLAGPDGHLPESEMVLETKHPWEWSFHNHHAAYRDDISPYDYGWIPELEILDAEGATQAVKHYAMGRFSHELGLVMPDERTVYMTDDQYHAGFFLFVADTPRDLSAGTLYAARWRQTDGTRADLDWVSLGHATDAEVRTALFENRPDFTDLFDIGELTDGSCIEGFQRTTTTWGTECLRVRNPLLASRLETRRFAGLKGATTEFTKNEGLALDAGGAREDARLYIAMSKIDLGMLDETDASLGPERSDYRRSADQDHIRMEMNPCGVVFALAPGASVDHSGSPIDSEWVMRTARPALTGRPVEVGCAEDGIANPDNLTFIDDYGLLIISEDTSMHAADTLWAFDPRGNQALIPLMQVDPASEVTGIHWFSDIGGWSYLTVSNQWDDLDWPAHHTVMGVLGPFPAQSASRSVGDQR